MNHHCSDDDLVLAYYGESDAHETHLAACVECALRYRELRAALDSAAAPDIPARGDHYGLEVWQRIRHRLPDQRPAWVQLLGLPSAADRVRWRLPAFAAAALLLIALGFTAGRVSTPPQEAELLRASGVELVEDDGARKRMLMLTVADHFERSERVLTDIVNASAGTDLTATQEWADDLLFASRLYRQDAIDSQEITIASLLDELERTLLEIVHRPSLATDEDLETIRRQIDSVALLFKVRVMSNELRVTSTIG